VILIGVFSFQEHFASLHAEFKNEIALLKKIEHRNLVQLLGYIDKGNERIVITEFVSNGTLRDHLDGMLQTRLLLYSIPS
jgi:serine/threonine protein kinase